MPPLTSTSTSTSISPSKHPISSISAVLSKADAGAPGPSSKPYGNGLPSSSVPARGGGKFSNGPSASGKLSNGPNFGGNGGNGWGGREGGRGNQANSGMGKGKTSGGRTTNESITTVKVGMGIGSSDEEEIILSPGLDGSFAAQFGIGIGSNDEGNGNEEGFGFRNGKMVMNGGENDGRIIQEESEEWSQRFWMSVKDPVTGSGFYCNPSTGECRWSLDPGTFVVPRPSDGEWWELLDEARQLLYYYSPRTGQTTWHKPQDGGLIIPMVNVQQNTNTKRFSNGLANAGSWKEGLAQFAAQAKGDNNAPESATPQRTEFGDLDEGVEADDEDWAEELDLDTATNTDTLGSPPDSPVTNRHLVSSTSSMMLSTPDETPLSSPPSSPPPPTRTQSQSRRSGVRNRNSTNARGSLLPPPRPPLEPPSPSKRESNVPWSSSSFKLPSISIPADMNLTDDPSWKSLTTPKPQEREKEKDRGLGKKVSKSSLSTQEELTSEPSTPSKSVWGLGARKGSNNNLNGKWKGKEPVRPWPSPSKPNVGGISRSGSGRNSSEGDEGGSNSAFETAEDEPNTGFFQRPWGASSQRAHNGSSGQNSMAFPVSVNSSESGSPLANRLKKQKSRSRTNLRENNNLNWGVGSTTSSSATEEDLASIGTSMTNSSNATNTSNSFSLFPPSKTPPATPSTSRSTHLAESSTNPGTPQTVNGTLSNGPNGINNYAGTTPRSRPGYSRRSSSISVSKNRIVLDASLPPMAMTETSFVSVQGEKSPTSEGKALSGLQDLDGNGEGEYFSTRPISRPLGLDEVAAENMNPLSEACKVDRPILIEPEVKRLSTGSVRVMNKSLQREINRFSVEGYAKQFFATHKQGLFRRRVSIHSMMVWQKAPLSAPLLILNKAARSDALKCFKSIQKIMGDRERPHLRGSKSSAPGRPSNVTVASTIDLEQLGDAGDSWDAGLLQETKSLLELGILCAELRDEIYAQLIKQLTSNPSLVSSFRGWRLMMVLVCAGFPPSKNLEGTLRSFIADHKTNKELQIDVVSKFCLTRLDAIIVKGPRGKAPSQLEISAASEAAFNPAVFGETLEGIMRLQESFYPAAQLPIVLPFLAESLLALGGMEAEGTFRVPGDGDLVQEMKIRLDRGEYVIPQGIDDPHVMASLMKLWLRELRDPVIPANLYNLCVERAESPSAVVKIAASMPLINRRVLSFVIRFLQVFSKEEVVAKTKMSAQALAMVWAPNLLRCHSTSLVVAFTNTRYEQLFVCNLINHLDCSTLDPDYNPTIETKKPKLPHIVTSSTPNSPMMSAFISPPSPMRSATTPTNPSSPTSSNPLTNLLPQPPQTPTSSPNNKRRHQTTAPVIEWAPTPPELIDHHNHHRQSGRSFGGSLGSLGSNNTGGSAAGGGGGGGGGSGGSRPSTAGHSSHLPHIDSHSPRVVRTRTKSKSPERGSGVSSNSGSGGWGSGVGGGIRRIRRNSAATTTSKEDKKERENNNNKLFQNFMIGGGGGGFRERRSSAGEKQQQKIAVGLDGE